MAGEMQLALAIKGDLRKQTAAVVKAGAQAVTTVGRRKTTVGKNAIRRKVVPKTTARLGNTIRDRTFPARGASLDFKGQVFSSAIYKRAGGFADLITVFRFGAIIHPIRGLFLFIGKRLAKGAKIGDSRIAKAKEVKIVPRIGDLEAEWARVTGSFEADVVKEYDRQLAKAGG